MVDFHILLLSSLFYTYDTLPPCIVFTALRLFLLYGFLENHGTLIILVSCHYPSHIHEDELAFNSESSVTRICQPTYTIFHGLLTDDSHFFHLLSIFFSLLTFLKLCIRRGGVRVR